MTSATAPLSSDRQLKTLVLTDLCDSVALTARIGDAAAAELFRTLDVRALQLLQRWKGRLIDRSDGMFLLFDVPTQGLGFALDYLDALAEVGKERKLPLQARIGIHVGDVLFWRNDDDAVAAGAKPLEVEGVAKPTAARLMALARPNQILLSAVAEALLRAGQRELGERGANLQWKSHGRWYFKGLPTPQEVFEVGAAGSAPLRMPPRSNKAWRRLPLWRRPAALVAELLLVVAVGAVAWVLVRPEPAIAFAERDWVVIGDVNNLTDNQLLGDGLNRAFRIGLEQSRYVNILSELKARDTLTRMLLPEGSAIDRVTASGIAVREGARAVLIPVVRESSGKLQVSVDVVEPESGRVVYTVHSSGIGTSTVLQSIDDVIGQLRGRLGEALADVEKSSAPLPKVATANLDALHAYAAAQAAYASGEAEKSIQYFDVATRVDGGFAMARLGKMRALVNLGRYEDARKELEAATEFRSRLTTREALYMDAWSADLLSGSGSEAFQAWAVLAELYPDHQGANVNAAAAALLLGRYTEAAKFASRADIPQSGQRGGVLRLLGRIRLAQDQIDPALLLLRDPDALPASGMSRYLVTAMAASGDKSGAHEMLRLLPPGDPGLKLDAAALALDQGRNTDALAVSEAAAAACPESSFMCDFMHVADLVTKAAAGSCASNREVGRILDRLAHGPGEMDVGDAAGRRFLAGAAIYAAQRMGSGINVTERLPPLKRAARESNDLSALRMIDLVEINQLRMSGDAAGAVARLQPLVNGEELFQVHSLLAQAYADAGDKDGQQREASWMQKHRGRAYAEWIGSAPLQALNVRDSLGTPLAAGCLRPTAGKSDLR